jgi:hypothetical protein
MLLINDLMTSFPLDRPAVVLFVLVEQRLPHCARHRYLMTGIGTHLAKQRADGVILACDAVEPPLDRGVCKSDRIASDRMLPFLRGKRFDLCPQFALSGGPANSWPITEKRNSAHQAL